MHSNLAKKCWHLDPVATSILGERPYDEGYLVEGGRGRELTRRVTTHESGEGVNSIGPLIAHTTIVGFKLSGAHTTDRLGQRVTPSIASQVRAWSAASQSCVVACRLSCGMSGATPTCSKCHSCAMPGVTPTYSKCHIKPRTLPLASRGAFRFSVRFFHFCIGEES